MNISQSGLTLLKQFEGLRTTVYKDIAGVPTIGYGSTYCICGSKVTMAYPPITELVAEAMLRNNIRVYEAAVNGSVTVPLTQHKFDALVSLCYNIGVGNFKSSTLLRKLNQHDYAGAADQFKVWRLAGGKVSEGLVNRRRHEEALFRFV